jgi:hypothetical protein
MIKPDDEESLDLVEVHKAFGPAEAEVIRTMLESYGIQCLFRGKVLQSVLPFSADGMGEIKILVLKKDLSKAKKLIEQEEKPE